MSTSLVEFIGDKLLARLGSVPGEKGQSSAGSEASEAVEELESAAGEALGSTPFLKPPPLASDEDLCLAPAVIANPASA